MLKTAAIAALLTAGALVPAANAATINVTTTLDGTITSPQTQDGLCSLREAVLAAEFDTTVQGCPAGSGPDVIALPPGTFTLTTSGFNEDGGFTGDLDVKGSPVRVVGSGAGATVIQVGFQDRAFDVLSTGDLTLEGLTVRGARMPASTGASGAGVRNQGKLTVVRAAFDDNAAASAESPGGKAGEGGAIWSGNPAAPSVTVLDSTFTNNRAGAGGVPSGSGGSGGAIRIASGTLSVARSTFAGNVAGTGAGGVGSGGLGGRGGAIAVGPGVATITGSTFASNRGGQSGSNVDGGLNPNGGNGGAVSASGGQALIDWSTFLGNVRGEGSQGSNGIAGAIVGGSILADPEPRCEGVVASVPNLLNGPDGVCLPGSPVGDPRLGLLGPNGGPTPTLLPGAGSAAIDGAGAGCPATDQRGLARPALRACDFGAVEIQPSEPSAPGAGTPAPVRRTLAPGGTTLRRISGVTLSRSAFRTYGKKKGTTLGVRLSVPSRIVLTVTKPATGRRSKGKCVAPTKKLSGKTRCTRQVPLRGSLSANGKAGLNTIAFSGKLRGRALAPGAYTFVITLPKSGAAKAVVATKGFRVIP